MWCLIGCSIGDFGTIAFFQFADIQWPVFLIMTLAIINGLITSIALETFILSRQMEIKSAFNTAIGMSFISMISMELAMNLTDVLLTGGGIISEPDMKTLADDGVGKLFGPGTSVNETITYITDWVNEYRR